MANDAVTESAPKTHYLRRTITGVLVVVAFVVLYLATLPLYRSNGPVPPQRTGNIEKQIGRIGEGYFNFQIVDTALKRTRGLSGTEPLPDTDAMLFVFDQSERHCFWMKDMRYSLDILWFDDSKTLVYEQRNVSPGTYPQTFCSDAPARYVVEVTAGVAEKNQVKIGDRLDINL